jgi:putative glutathione S-transferase
MGRLVEGEWVADDVAATDASGRWTRAPSVRRDWVRADGSTPFVPEAGRYHLWLAWNCTWSHRAMIVRNLLGLEDAIGVSMAHWHRNDGGWWYREGLDALRPTRMQRWETWSEDDGFQPAEAVPGVSLWEVYVADDPSYTGRATVPVLWDRQLGRVVSNESADILRMLELEFGALSNGRELLPEGLRGTIDELNDWVYPCINNGVYEVGFARSQGAYREASDRLFTALQRADDLLADRRYLAGDVLTEADVRLFPTLIRFDVVYYSHFKCSRRRIVDFPHLWPYLRDLYQTPGFAETVDLLAYKLGYMGRSERLNPSRIIRAGPELELGAPHGRG